MAAAVKRKRASKVLWFNSAVAGAAAAAPVIVDNIALLKPYAGELYPGMLFVALVGNAILRFYTKEPLK